jgi:hypothetical protein
VANDVRIERVTRPGEGLDKLKQIDKSTAIKIGVISGTGEHPKGTAGQTIAEIAWWNEFGTKNIPERPFLRPALRDNLPAYRSIIESALKAILGGKLKPDQAIGVLGERAQRDVQNRITVLADPPNAEATIEAKGSSSPLIDIGALRQAIRWAKVDR